MIVNKNNKKLGLAGVALACALGIWLIHDYFSVVSPNRNWIEDYKARGLLIRDDLFWQACAAFHDKSSGRTIHVVNVTSVLGLPDTQFESGEKGVKVLQYSSKTSRFGDSDTVLFSFLNDEIVNVAFTGMPFKRNPKSD